MAREREEHIANVNSLFTELERQNNLGRENLSILKTIATEVKVLFGYWYFVLIDF